MSDNEKAATFIGWRLTDRTEGQTENSWATPAPDMTDPRNYMKALEQGVVGEDMWLQLEGSQLATNDYKSQWRSRVGTDIWRIGATAAESIIKTLAALYDAEHTS